MTHGDDSWSIRTLLLLQASTPDSAYLMREMLCESIQAKYPTRRLKPVPLLGPNNSIYVSPEEVVPPKQKKTEVQKIVIPDENSNDSCTDYSEDLEVELTCCVCKSFSFHVWNPIVECAECHAGYHKECHEPEIMEDVSDPRVVWYCKNCSNSMQSDSKPVGSVGFSSSTSKAVPSSGKQSSSSSRSNSPPVSTSYGSKSSFGGKRPVQNKLSVLSSSSGKVHPKINIISADRRLQIMKKKAARKQDKRSAK